MRTRPSFTQTMLPQPHSAIDVSPRRLAGHALAEALRDSRQRTLTLVQDLSDEQWMPAYQSGINPVAWELGHLAWFTEFWTLRGPHRLDAQGFVHADLLPTIVGPDAVFDSARLAHAARWSTGIPCRAELLAMLERQLDVCIQRIPDTTDDAALYFHRLSLFHEDMHGEAFAWMRAALGYAAPRGLSLTQQNPGPRLRFEGSGLVLPPTTGTGGFLFDNEERRDSTTLCAFDIDSGCVTAGAFMQFVEAGGYDHPDYWPGDAGTWRSQNGRSHPCRWRREGLDWQVRWFDRWEPLNPHLPIIHVNAFEAEAYCTWLGRRLPRAGEWEYAASNASGDRFQWGTSVWEWTADAFAPYEGFSAGPYRDYSQPWFGNHRELRGGSFAAHIRMQSPPYRNFFQQHRADIFAGFRTAAAL